MKEVSNHSLKAFTDYPFAWMGDVEGEIAPVRECTVHSYDGDKYCKITVEGVSTEVKSGYLYKTKGRFGKVKQIDVSALPVKY